MKITGISAEMKRLRSGLNKFEQEAVADVRVTSIILLKNLFKRTPVWSGESVRNYKVGINRVVGGSTKPAIGSGNPGPTSTMSLGAEPRRAANESAAMSGMIGILPKRKLKTIVFTNTIDSAKWDLIDSGSAPSPGAARNPGGVVVIARQITVAQRRNWK